MLGKFRALSRASRVAEPFNPLRAVATENAPVEKRDGQSDDDAPGRSQRFDAGFDRPRKVRGCLRPAVPRRAWSAQVGSGSAGRIAGLFFGVLLALGVTAGADAQPVSTVCN